MATSLRSAPRVYREAHQVRILEPHTEINATHSPKDIVQHLPTGGRLFNTGSYDLQARVLPVKESLEMYPKKD
jgi:hypothetical protein